MEIVSATAVWYHSGQPPVPLRWVLIRDPAGQCDTQALLCTDVAAAPEQILPWFVQRWQLEVTCEEARRHLGVETQRQWSDAAIRRTTPALFGLFSLVTLVAQHSLAHKPSTSQHAAWYHKPRPTFSDALALVRRQLWGSLPFCLSPHALDVVKLPRTFVQHLTDTLCYAA